MSVVTEKRLFYYLLMIFISLNNKNKIKWKLCKLQILDWPLFTMFHSRQAKGEKRYQPSRILHSKTMSD